MLLNKETKQNPKSKLIHWNYIFLNGRIGLMSRVFASGPADRGSIFGWVIPKT